MKQNSWYISAQLIINLPDCSYFLSPRPSFLQLSFYSVFVEDWGACLSPVPQQPKSSKWVGEDKCQVHLLCWCCQKYRLKTCHQQSIFTYMWFLFVIGYGKGSKTPVMGTGPPRIKVSQNVCGNFQRKRQWESQEVKWEIMGGEKIISESWFLENQLKLLLDLNWKQIWPPGRRGPTRRHSLY